MHGAHALRGFEVEADEMTTMALRDTRVRADEPPTSIRGDGTVGRLGVSNVTFERVRIDLINQ